VLNKALFHVSIENVSVKYKSFLFGFILDTSLYLTMIA
jgi:hypothetical protein